MPVYHFKPYFVANSLIAKTNLDTNKFPLVEENQYFMILKSEKKSTGIIW